MVKKKETGLDDLEILSLPERTAKTLRDSLSGKMALRKDMRLWPITFC